MITATAVMSFGTTWKKNILVIKLNYKLTLDAAVIRGTWGRQLMYRISSIIRSARD
jgi:hypothetical protein